jgi:membrane associated rhomboid family serine protease
MTSYERDYYREGAAGLGFGNQLRLWSVTTWLIILNVAVFVADALLERFVGEPYLTVWGDFSAVTAVLHTQVWRFLTFQFLHSGLGHLFFNMLTLFFFGPMVEGFIGARRFIGFYLLCGVAGAATYLILWAAHVPGIGSYTSLVGASAGIFGVLIAAAQLAPDTRVMLLFPPIPMKLRTLAWGVLAISAFMVITNAENAGGEAAHLGGAALGFLLITKLHWLNFLEGVSFRKISPGAIRQQVHKNAWQRRMQEAEELEREVDRILDKVAKEGMASLTSREKRTLQRATELQRRG